MVKLTLMEVGIKDLQAQAQSFCDTATGGKEKDSHLFYKAKLTWNIFSQKTIQFILIICTYQ